MRPRQKQIAPPVAPNRRAPQHCRQYGLHQGGAIVSDRKMGTGEFLATAIVLIVLGIGGLMWAAM